jgi:hypothetical protein
MLSDTGLLPGAPAIGSKCLAILIDAQGTGLIINRRLGLHLLDIAQVDEVMPRLD